MANAGRRFHLAGNPHCDDRVSTGASLAVISANLFGLKMFQITQTKLNVNDVVPRNER